MTQKQPTRTALVSLSLIDVPKKRRRLRTEVVAEIAESVGAVGLFQPIGLRPIGDRFRLIFGRHRLEAYRKLGRPEIPAIVLDLDDAFEASASDAENLFRNPLAPAERLLALKRWSARTDTEHLEPQHRKGDGSNENNADDLPARSLQHAHGVMTRPSKATKQHLATDDGLTEEELIVLADREVGQVDLASLAKIQDPDRRRAAISLIASGLSPKAAIAFSNLPPNTTVTEVIGDLGPLRPVSDYSDEEWLDYCCGEVMARLKSTAAFKRDALLYRRTSEERARLWAGTKKALAEAKGQQVGPFFMLLSRLVNIDHPKNWLHCGPCEGTGASGDGSKCGYCYGHGYSTRTSVR